MILILITLLIVTIKLIMINFFKKYIYLVKKRHLSEYKSVEFLINKIA